MNLTTKKRSLLLATTLMALVLTACPRTTTPAPPSVNITNPAGTSATAPEEYTLQQASAGIQVTATVNPPANVTLGWTSAPASGVSFSTTTAANTEVTITQPGDYALTLQARRQNVTTAGQAIAYITVTGEAEPGAPTVSIAEYSTDQENPTSLPLAVAANLPLAGTVTPAAGTTIASTTWSSTSESVTFEPTDAPIAVATVADPAVGTSYDFTLTAAVEGSQATGTATVYVTFAEDEEFGVTLAPAGPFTIPEGQTMVEGELTGTVIAPEGADVTGTTLAFTITPPEGVTAPTAPTGVPVGEDGTFSAPVTFAAVGDYQVIVAATLEGETATSTPITVTVQDGTTPPAPFIPLPLPEGAILINAGGPETSIGGNTFVADEGLFVASAATGNSFTSTNSITLPEGFEAFEPIFQTERNTGQNDQSSTLTYTIDAPNGTYDVYLLFAELFYGVEGTGGANLGAGARVFNASVQGTDLLTDYDVFVEGGNTPLIGLSEVAQSVVVTDGAVTINLTSVANRAKINGIIIVPSNGE